MTFDTEHERRLWILARTARLETWAVERKNRWLTGALWTCPAVLIVAYGLGAAWGR